MSKKGRLNKSEKYVIEGMFEDGHTFDEIATETGRTAGTIENHIRLIAEAANGEDTEAEKPKRKGLFIRETMLKKNTGVSIMTEAESSRGEIPKTQSKIKKRFRPTIHKIDEDRE